MNCSVLTSSEAASVSACSVEKSMTLPILSERVSFSFCSSLSVCSSAGNTPSLRPSTIIFMAVAGVFRSCEMLLSQAFLLLALD